MLRVLTLVTCLCAITPAARAQWTWDLATLARAPKTRAAPGFKSMGLRPLFFQGPSWKGRATEVFAWYGAPKRPRGRLPAMVLVHGGGGTAFAEWVQLWVDRGYAAIAMDLCGSVPMKTAERRGWQRHPKGGPPGWGGFEQIDDPESDQWTYHAIADVILAHSLLRSFREVDRERIGITGISWGGYLTSIAASVDERFKLAAPVYGCGFLGENSVWLDTFAKMGEEKAHRWLQLWDPSHYLAKATVPFLWVNGTNDFAYPMDSYQKSYRLPAGERTVAMRVGMKHAHGGPGERPEEIRAFADALFRGDRPLARITGQGLEGRQLWATYGSAVPLVRAELNFTTDSGKWQDRHWQTVPAEIDGNRVHAELPPGARVAFLNVVDHRDLVVSTEHVELAGR